MLSIRKILTQGVSNCLKSGSLNLLLIAFLSLFGSATSSAPSTSNLQAPVYEAASSSSANNRSAPEKGTVIIRALVGVDGHVKDAQVMQSSGYSTLDEAAQRYANTMILKPGMKDGQPIEAWTSFKIRFDMKDSANAEEPKKENVR